MFRMQMCNMACLMSGDVLGDFVRLDLASGFRRAGLIGWCTREIFVVQHVKVVTISAFWEVFHCSKNAGLKIGHTIPYHPPT